MTDWNEDEAALLEQIGRFAQNVLAPRAAELDETATFAICHLPAMADLGLMGLNLPQDVCTAQNAAQVVAALETRNAPAPTSGASIRQ